MSFIAYSVELCLGITWGLYGDFFNALPTLRTPPPRLAAAGYTFANWEVLERDLHQLSKTHEVSDTENSPYGIKYEVRGTLTGPNGWTLHVVTAWITLEATGETRFVTLFPDREGNR